MDYINKEIDRKHAQVLPMTASSSSSSPLLLDSSSEKSNTCSIGIQTESHPVDLSLPLWALALCVVPVRDASMSKRALKRAAAAGAAATIDDLAPIVPPKSMRPFPLYSDVLQVVLRYLRPNDILTAIHLSKHWYQSFKSANLGLTSGARANALARMPANSAFARQIARAHELTAAISVSRDLVHPGFNILSHLAMLLPNLTCLSCAPIATGNYSLPPLLQTLSVTVSNSKNYIPFFEAIRSLKRLKELHLQVSNPGALDYSALVPLPQLEILNLANPDQSARGLSIADVTSLAFFVRQTQVRSLTFEFSSSQLLSQVLDPTFVSGESFPLIQSGNLTSIYSGKTTLDRPLLQSLLNYPTLTQLLPSHIDLDMHDVALLTKLPQVTNLGLVKSAYSNTRTTTDTIVEACKNLPSLSKLQIKGWYFNNKQMDECLSYLPHLTDLNLIGSESSTTFVSLGKYGLPQRLRKLSLKTFLVPISDLKEYILPLQQLESLHLREVCESEVPAYIEESLLKMPNLKSSNLNLPASIVLRRKRAGIDSKRKTPSRDSGLNKRAHRSSRSSESDDSDEEHRHHKMGMKRQLQRQLQQTERRMQQLSIRQPQAVDLGLSSFGSSSIPLAAPTATPKQDQGKISSFATPSAAFDFSPSQLGSSFAIGASSSPAKAKSPSVNSPLSTQRSGGTSRLSRLSGHAIHNNATTLLSENQSAGSAADAFSIGATAWTSPEKMTSPFQITTQLPSDSMTITNPFSFIPLSVTSIASPGVHKFGEVTASSSTTAPLVQSSPSFSGASGLNALTEVALQ